MSNRVFIIITKTSLYSMCTKKHKKPSCEGVLKEPENSNIHTYIWNRFNNTTNGFRAHQSAIIYQYFRNRVFIVITKLSLHSMCTKSKNLKLHTHYFKSYVLKNSLYRIPLVFYHNLKSNSNSFFVGVI